MSHITVTSQAVQAVKGQAARNDTPDVNKIEKGLVNAAHSIAADNDTLKRDAATIARNAKNPNLDPQTIASDKATIARDVEISWRVYHTMVSALTPAGQVLHSGTGSGPKGATSLYAGFDAVFLAIDDYMHTLNALQLANAALMQQSSQQEVAQNQVFENSENVVNWGPDGKTPTSTNKNPDGTTNPYSNDLFMLENVASGDAAAWSARYQDDNTKNQAIVKQIDTTYQQWQAAVNQNNQNQSPILAVANAMNQWISNFLSRIHV